MEHDEADKLRATLEALAKNPQGQSEDMEANGSSWPTTRSRHCKIKLQEHRDSPNDVAFGLLEAVTEHLRKFESRSGHGRETPRPGVGRRAGLES